jgi:hypothetical protein
VKKLAPTFPPLPFAIPTMRQQLGTGFKFSVAFVDASETVKNSSI